ncbi:hypothetical protein RDABS01_024957 [Bienertia sinuspersici]
MMGHSEKDCRKAEPGACGAEMGWGLWLKASPRKGWLKRKEEAAAVATGRKCLFVTKPVTMMDKGESKGVGVDGVREQGEVRDVEGVDVTGGCTREPHATEGCAREKVSETRVPTDAVSEVRGVLEQGRAGQEETIQGGSNPINNQECTSGLTKEMLKFSMGATGMQGGERGSRGRGVKKVNIIKRRKGEGGVSEEGEGWCGSKRKVDMDGGDEGFCVSSNGHLGGLGLWWRNVNAHLISFSDHHIAVEVRGGNNEPLWAAVGVYGWADNMSKHLTWKLMREIKEYATIPIVFFGDFNEILSETEKEGGASRDERRMDAFRETVDVCLLRDLGFTGSMFTWQRGNDPVRVIRERLDRFRACVEWCALFPWCSVRHFSIYKSDHAPILLSADTQRLWRNGGKRFTFEALWLANGGCEGVVKEAWGGNAGASISTKLDTCASELSLWAKKTFGDVKKRIKEKERELKEWQGRVPDGPMLERCKEIVGELDDLQRLEETYWHARARANELRDGDKNTSYFHHKASQRRRRNFIKELEDSEGNVRKEEGAIGDIITSYFTNMFTSSNPSGFDEALVGIDNMVTEDMNASLVVEPTAEEIRDALFQMHPNKAPGVDGMHAIFSRSFGTLWARMLWLLFGTGGGGTKVLVW